MSAVATMHYNPAFSMGDRADFNWPATESYGSGILSSSQVSSYGSDGSMTPPSISRSATASPPRIALSTEAMALRRQRDQYRRENKLVTRARRADSNDSCESAPLGQLSPPRSLRDLAPSSLGIYSAAPSQLSLPSESTTMAPSPYMAAAYSPPLNAGSNEPLFSSYPAPTPYMPDYSSSYQTPSISSTATASPQPPQLPSQYHRGGMTTEPPMLYPMPYPMSHTPQPQQPQHQHPHSHPHSHSHDSVLNGGVRVVQSRPKPQCWEHGCNGRQFSTFSNLLRHQREKSGHATKSVCPNCGAEFTRTTARNGHLQHDKCKQRKSSGRDSEDRA